MIRSFRTQVARLAPLASFAALAVSLIACGAVASSPPALQTPAGGLPSGTADPSQSSTPGALAPTTAALLLPSSTPLPADPTPSPSPTSLPVSVSATAGNLTIRRGPGLAYNSVGFLLVGMSVAASGRSADEEWLYVENPDRPAEFGWVSAGSRYLSTSGDPTGLPTVPAEPAQPAFLRNCTFHPMKIVPGEFLLKEQFDAPNNRRQLNPGTYEAYDMNQEGNPKVLTVDLREGVTKDIVTDGLGNTYGCP